MKKSLIKISAFILLSSSIIMFPASVHASETSSASISSETSENSTASETSALYLKNFLLENDSNRKLAADSLNFNSYWSSAHYLTSNQCFNYLLQADGNLVFTSLRSNPKLMLTIVNVDISSHLFKNTGVPVTTDNPVIVYQITSKESSYPLLWIVDAVTGTVYCTQDYPGAAIYEMKDNSIVQTYFNGSKCLLWR